MPKLRLEHETLSSGHIRTLIAEAAFGDVERCLGRPYSIYAPLFFERSHYMQLAQHCLPPSGSYPVRCAIEKHSYQGTAHVDRPKELIRIELFDAPLTPQTTFAELFF
jgi:FAD synthase